MAKRHSSRPRARRRHRATRQTTQKTVYRRALRYEPLEHRRLLALVTVDTLADTIDLNDGRTSFREAIFATNLVSGPDTIEFAPALTAAGPATILLTRGELKITDDLAINGPGADLFTIDASGNDPTPDIDDGKGSRVFNIDDGLAKFVNVSIAGITLTGGDANDVGGAVRSVEPLKLIESRIVGNSGRGGGGGIYVLLDGPGSVEIVSSVISQNYNSFEGGGGGALFHKGDGDIFISDSTVSLNRAEGTVAQGGGLRVGHGGAGNIIVSGGMFSQNSTQGTLARGGGLFVNRSGTGNVNVTRVIFLQNSTRGTVASGGGMSISNTGSGIAEVRGNLFTRNLTEGTSDEGLGIYAVAGPNASLAIRANEVIDNVPTALRDGHEGIATVSGIGSKVLIEDNVVSGNREGIGVNGSGLTEVRNNTIVGNVGPGLVLSTSRTGGTVHASENLILNNESVYSAGAGLIVNANRDALVTIRNTTLAGNRTHRVGGGGYILARQGGVVEISDTTLNDNRAIRTDNPDSGIGGGLYIRVEEGRVQLDQVTLSANLADEHGGGIWVHNKLGETAIHRSTITQNVADANKNGIGIGGGIHAHSSSIVDLDHSIVAGNDDNNGIAKEIAGVIHSSYSLIGFGASSFGPLADNGGPTMTHALLPGSPAIDMGDPAAVAGEGGVPHFDQRGEPFTRVFGGRIDIGAFESQPNPLLGDYRFNGLVDAADYAIWRHTVGSSNDLRADGNGDGIVDQADYDVWRAHFGQVLTRGGGISSDAAGASADSVTSQTIVDSARTQRPATLANVPSDSYTARESRPRPAEVPWDDLLETSPTDRRRTLLDWQATRGHDDQSARMRTSLSTRNRSADSARGDFTFESIEEVFRLLGIELQEYG